MKRINRVRKHQEFDAIIREAHYLKSPHFVVYFHSKDDKLTRIGISVSTRNGNAVKRNLIKRQIRAMIAHGYKMDNHYDIIIIVRTSYDPSNYGENESELMTSLRKIGESNIETKHKN
jgi:ribonuclease P protein component